MRRVLVLSLTLMLSTVGCASSGGTSGRRQGPATVSAVPASFGDGNDRDDDGDHNNDDAHVLLFGEAAGGTDRKESIALVKNYFAAAAAGDGAAGCRLLVPFVAAALPEIAGHQPGAGCALTLSRQFARRHRLLVEKRATMRFLAVRVHGNRGLVVLAFPTVREVRQMVEWRVAGHWRLLHIFDGIIE
jgi:hypothetical protein